jgi:ketopantoate reductase
LPPENAQSIGVAALDEFAKGRNGPTVGVFCNNGLVDWSEILAREGCLERRTWLPVRALLNVGFFREESPEKTIIQHRGGKKIIIGPADTEVDTAEALEHFLNLARGLNSQGGSFYDWTYSTEIRKEEWLKFFVNFVLALVIGPHLAPNKSLYEKIETPALSWWAAKFAEASCLEAQPFLQRLQFVVSETAENFNSVSVAGARGYPQTFLHFLDKVVEKIPTLGEDAQAQLQQAKRTWNVAQRNDAASTLRAE